MKPVFVKLLFGLLMFSVASEAIADTFTKSHSWYLQTDSEESEKKPEESKADKTDDSDKVSFNVGNSVLLKFSTLYNQMKNTQIVSVCLSLPEIPPELV